MVDLENLRFEMEINDKSTFTKEEVFALLDAAMDGRMRASIVEENIAYQCRDHDEDEAGAHEHQTYANTHYDEADGIRYAMMEFGMEFDAALEHRDNLWDELNARFAKPLT